MFLFASGQRKCVKALLKNVYTPWDFEKLLKRTHISWAIFLIVFKTKECVKKLLKMNQKPYNMYQTILRQRYLKRQCTGLHTPWSLFLINVGRGMKNIHGGWKKFLIVLKPKGCVKKLLKINQKTYNMYQTIFRRKRCALRQFTGNHTYWWISWIILKHKKCAISQ